MGHDYLSELCRTIRVDGDIFTGKILYLYDAALLHLLFVTIFYGVFAPRLETATHIHCHDDGIRPDRFHFRLLFMGK